jgi:integrase
VAVKWSDISRDGVLSVSRRIYHGGLDTLKSKRAIRNLPLEPELCERLRTLGEGHEWIFRSIADRPLSPENALKRHIRPVVKELGIELGGWHDFRHTLSTTLRRNGTHPKVVSDILGHSKVNLAMDVYDRTSIEDFAQPLASVSANLRIDVAKAAPTNADVAEMLKCLPQALKALKAAGVTDAVILAMVQA